MNHIVFHNDIDGIISASLLQIYDPMFKESRLHPVTSTMRGGQIKKVLAKIKPEDKLAIVDFEYNERADIWYDHHFNNDMGSDQFSNGHLFYNPAAKSTVDIIAAVHVPRTELQDVIAMSSMIDSATYPDIEYIFRNTSPIMILRAFLETAFPADMTYCRIVEMLTRCKLDVEKAISLMGIDKSSVDTIRNMAKKIGKNTMVFGKCSVVNQTRQSQFPRYSEFFVRPETEYSIRISLSGPHQKYIQIGHNKWLEPSVINLGGFMRGLSYVRGGGHFNVAAGTIKNCDEQRFLDDMDIHFNEREGMEKYAVDPTDPVEERAKDLEKTGVDISEARKKSQKEMEEKSDEGKLRS